MMYIAKLSRRLALLRDALVIVLAVATVACSDDQLPLGPSRSSNPATASVLAGDTELGARVATTTSVTVRSRAASRGKVLGTQPSGAQGTIRGGPATSGGIRWFDINFDSGADGWVEAGYLARMDTLSSAAAALTLTPESAVVAPAAILATQVTVTGASGDTLTGQRITYSISDTAIATVDSLGVITGRTEGSVTLRAKVDAVTASLEVTVTATRLAVGASALADGLIYLREHATVNSAIVGEQASGAVGTVLRGPIVDTAGDGRTRWWVDFPSGTDGWAAEPYIVLDTASTAPASPVVATVTVSPATMSLLVGATGQLAAVARDAAGAEVPGVSVTWTSRDPSRVGVSPSGLVTALAAGTVWVIASTSGIADSAAVTVASVPAQRVGHYVDPSGRSTNSGTISSPWDLATALSGASGKVLPGDTVWIRGGTYSGSFTSSVAGTSGKPVVFRAYPGERATIAHAGSALTTLQVRGAWTVMWGIEVMNPNTTRTTSSTGSEQRPNGIVNNASNTKYINVVVHDAGVAFYNYTQHTNVEVSGSVFYNNGWQGPDRGHGHALYLKSDVGPVIIRDNVLFNQFGYGVHVYTNSGSGKLNNIRIERNTAFNNGTLSTNSNSENILLGGADYSTGSSVVGNLTYFTPGLGGRNVRVGYSTLVNGSVTVTGNHIIGGSPAFDFGYWSSATVRDNVLLGAAQMVRLNNTTTSGTTWAANTQHRSPTASAWYYSGSWRTFGDWQSRSGLGATDVATSLLPSLPKIEVRANAYEPGRATITVYDWAKTGSVVATISGVLALGDRYEVRSVQDLYGPALVSGSFGGSVTLPMGAVTPAAPIGMSSSSVPRTGAEFDTFIITRVP